MNRELNIPKVVYLYDEGVERFNFKQISSFLKKNFGIKIYLVKLKKKVVSTKGLLFDFIGTQDLFSKLKQSKLKDSCHIILTDKLFFTIADDKRPHIRSIICSYPSVISTSGIVEGPAKPKEFYLYKQKYSQLGVWEIEEEGVKKKFKGKFIDYADRRINEVLKGYISQALFYYITGNPFCEKKGCRLYNAHWQEDLICAQIKKGSFCIEHKRVMQKIKNST